MFVLPIGGADMPVVISLLNAFTGLSAAAAGIALDNVALIVGGMLVGRLRLDPHEPDGRGHEPLDRRTIFAGGFGGVERRARRGGDGEQKPVRSTDAADVAIQLAYADARWSWRPATAWRSPRPSTPCASWPTSWRSAASR